MYNKSCLNGHALISCQGESNVEDKKGWMEQVPAEAMLETRLDV